MRNFRPLLARSGPLALALIVALSLMGLSHAVSRASAPGELILPQEQEVVDLVNAERRKVGLVPLIVNYSLQEAAWSHNEHMVATGCFSHTNCGNGGPGDRVRKTGYEAVTVGENIAKGYRSPVDAMRAWMNSTGHRRNILGDRYTDIGVAYNPNGPHWTQVFAAPKPDYMTVTPPSGGPGSTPVPCKLLSDVNGDGVVDQADVTMITGAFLLAEGDERWDPRLDVVPDGVVNIYDIFQVVSDKGMSCP